MSILLQEEQILILYEDNPLKKKYYETKNIIILITI